jgi:hypothetical protein
MRISRMLFASIASFAVGCSSNGEPSSPPTLTTRPVEHRGGQAAPDGARSLNSFDFDVEVDQRAGTMTFTRAGAHDDERAHASAVSPLSFMRLPNPRDVLEFLNNGHSPPDCTCGTPPESHSFCSSASVISYFTVPVDQVWAKLTYISDPRVSLRMMPQDVPPPALASELADNVGLINYGRLDLAVDGRAARDWNFSVPNSDNFTYGVRLEGAPARATYDVSVTPHAAFFDACTDPGRATGPGTSIGPGTNGATVKGNLPFPITLFDRTGVTFKFNAKGVMWFDISADPSNPGATAGLPTITYPPGTAFPFWADQSPSATPPGEVCYAVDGAAPNRIFSVTWKNMRLSHGSSGLLTYTARFNEKSDVVEYLYNQVGASVPATVGVQGTNCSASTAYQQCPDAAGCSALADPGQLPVSFKYTPQ